LRLAGWAKRRDGGFMNINSDGSISDLLKWFSSIKLFIFERKPRNRISGVRFQVSVVRNELADT